MFWKNQKPADKTDRVRALADELRAVRGRTFPGGSEAALHAFAAALRLRALCLSGGGIRSAAFCLGVVQVLARGGLLGQFDYLSSVSGGGYINALLQGMIRNRGSVSQMQQALGDRRQTPAELARLRAYTNYLIPEAGLVSLDAWADLVLYVRNVLLTWLVYLPVLMLPIVLAIAYRTLIPVLGNHPQWQDAMLASGALCLAVGTAGAALTLPDHRQPRPGRPHYAMPGVIIGWAAVPILLWAFMAPLSRGWGSIAARPEPRGMVYAYVAALLLGYGVAWVIAAARRAGPALFWRNFGAWLLATLVSGLIVLGTAELAYSLPQSQQAQLITVGGPFLLVLATGIHSTIFVGVRRASGLFELDREWLARLNAYKLRLAAFWTLFTLCCLSLTWVIDTGSPEPMWITGLSGLASGWFAAWIGSQAQSKVGTLLSMAEQQQRVRTWLLNAAALLFILALIVLLGMAANAGLAAIQAVMFRMFDAHGMTISQFYDKYPEFMFVAQCLAVLIVGVLVLLVNFHVNINRYTLHAVYRNRLSRAFLGAARGAQRNADPFTDFDPDDNIPLSWLSGSRRDRRLFPVINMTLNLTAGSATAWTERKAMAFTATPLACGAPLLRRDGNRGSEDEAPGAYVPTIAYAGRESRRSMEEHPQGLSLATAMTISGAAISPNWGYHSSPLTAFAMSLFNVRLGAWLPNPAKVDNAKDMDIAAPPHALRWMLGDLFGRTSDTGPAIYLSDGGHFENLGLYEMLRRRCRMLLVIDATQDRGYGFEDLGNALRKAAIDMDITIRFEPALSDQAALKDALGYAIAMVNYPEGGAPAHLIYLKPTLLADIPTDVRAYANLHDTFPHDSTFDQLFTESQFESYRALGEFQMETVIQRVRDAVPKWQVGLDLDTFFERAFATYGGFGSS